MLDQSCAATPEASAICADISARIDFSAPFEAKCVLEFPTASAQRLAGAFLGSSDADWDLGMVEDTVGELCNMIAGGWKKRLGVPAWGADLSVPHISRGPDLDAANDADNRIRRTYAFDALPFAVSLTVS
jgi:chemotaxis protein CheX